MTLVFNLENDFFYSDWLEFRVPMGLLDILQPSSTTFTLTDG